MDNTSVKDKIVQEVVNKFIKRSNMGIKKYNTTLKDNDLPDINWLVHLQEELMDAVNYIQKYISVAVEPMGR